MIKKKRLQSGGEEMTLNSIHIITHTIFGNK